MCPHLCSPYPLTGCRIAEQSLCRVPTHTGPPAWWLINTRCVHLHIYICVVLEFPSHVGDVKYATRTLASFWRKLCFLFRALQNYGIDPDFLKLCDTREMHVES